jgi:hypothetical protein
MLHYRCPLPSMLRLLCHVTPCHLPAGYLYDPLNSFAFFRTDGAGAYGSRSNVTIQVGAREWGGLSGLLPACLPACVEACWWPPTLLSCLHCLPSPVPPDLTVFPLLSSPGRPVQDCMVACQEADDCESFVINEVLAQCFLKREQCPTYNFW